MAVEVVEPEPLRYPSIKVLEVVEEVLVVVAAEVPAESLPYKDREVILGEMAV